MKVQEFKCGRRARPDRGFTLLELIVATSILVILSGMAVPLAREPLSAVLHLVNWTFSITTGYHSSLRWRPLPMGSARVSI